MCPVTTDLGPLRSTIRVATRRGRHGLVHRTSGVMLVGALGAATVAGLGGCSTPGDPVAATASASSAVASNQTSAVTSSSASTPLASPSASTAASPRPGPPPPTPQPLWPGRR